MNPRVKVFIGADHRGVRLKAKIIKFLETKGLDVVDVGAFTDKVPCDYPKLSFAVAKGVLANKGARGILVCLSGLGHAIAANRVRGIRAVLCYNKRAAELSRAHNDANVLVLGSKFVTQGQIRDIITIWFKTAFEGGRHLRRLRQIETLSHRFKY